MRVLKLGGRAQSSPQLAAAIAEAWDASPGKLCVVHGGGEEVSAMQRALGRETQFVDGRRVTTGNDIELLRMILSGSVNKRLVNAFIAAGAPALGLSGEDNRLIGAEPIDMDSLGHVGEPIDINLALLTMLLRARVLPVISPVAFDVSTVGGGALNVNGDDAAAAIASALKAQELLFISDVEGVYGDDGMPIATLDAERARELIASGTAAGGMIAKLQAAERALAGGVERVRICDVTGLGDPERGTLITQSAGVAS